MIFQSTEYKQTLEVIKKQDPLRALKYLSKVIHRESRPVTEKEFSKNPDLKKEYSNYQFYITCFLSDEERKFYLNKLLQIREEIFYHEEPKFEKTILEEMKKNSTILYNLDYSIKWTKEKEKLELLLSVLENENLVFFPDKYDFYDSLLNGEFPEHRAKSNMKNQNVFKYLFNELRIHGFLEYKETGINKAFTLYFSNMTEGSLKKADARSIEKKVKKEKDKIDKILLRLEEN